MKNFDKFLDWARDNDWIIEEAEESYKMPPGFAGKIPQWESTAVGYNIISNREETVFLVVGESLQCEETESQTFRWDTFKNISLEASEGDEREAVTEWWKYHFPVLMIVSGEYEFYAADIRDGSVVNGAEPMFEETTKTADSIDEFFEMITKGEIIL